MQRNYYRQTILNLLEKYRVIKIIIEKKLNNLKQKKIDDTWSCVRRSKKNNKKITS